MDLQKFCASPDDCYHNNMSKPYSRGDYTYATNGHVLIRVPRINRIPEIPKAPSADKLWPVSKLTDYEIPAFSTPAFRPCPYCEGEGKWGNGVTCDECEGEKQLPDVKAIDVGPACYSDHYLTLIKELPELKFYPQKTDEYTYPPAYFTFNGGEGLLMPIRK